MTLKELREVCIAAREDAFLSQYELAEKLCEYFPGRAEVHHWLEVVVDAESGLSPLNLKPIMCFFKLCPNCK